MAQLFDVIIRGGTVVDGSGSEPFPADVAVTRAVIAAVGEIVGEAKEEIDARGKIVTPGFVDVHTHYDGQVTWENTLKPSTDHGVTTVIMGNCGVGFAPCRPNERHILEKVMEGVEDIPEIVMTEGLPWAWETFPDYLDFVGSRKFDSDVAAYLPHGAVRVYVMGERALGDEPPTQEDLDRMTALVAEGVRAGAVGVATSRTLVHRDSTGRLAPHVQSGREELLALAKGLRQAGKGIFQLVPRMVDELLKDYTKGGANAGSVDVIGREIDILREIAEVSGRPVTFTLLDLPEAPGLHVEVLKRLESLNKRGLKITAQVFPRPVGYLVGLDLSRHPFKFHPSYRPIMDLPLADRVEALRDPAMRKRLLAEQPDPNHANPVELMLISHSLNSYDIGELPNYDLKSRPSLKAEAAQRGVSQWEVALDWLLKRDGKNIFMAPVLNMSGDSLEAVHDMITDDNSLIGLGDGGAHYGFVCDAGYPTTLLAYWARDRKAPDRLPLAKAINLLSRRNALAMGLTDRGLIKVGMKADINVIDFDKLEFGPFEVSYDLPAAGRRVLQRAQGYEATLVSGIITHRNDRPTGATPGRLVKLAA